MKKEILILVFLSFFFFRAAEVLAEEPSKTRAISLKVLQERVNACQKHGGCSDDLLQLAGLKKIIGYVVDEKNRDLILVGKTDMSSPPLYLEDFAIALRNVALKYAMKKGNTYYISNPGCSIDPDPRVIQQLQIIGEKILGSSSSDMINTGIAEWSQTCQMPQGVRVLGIPFDSRFSSIMVKADYDMKKLVDGSEKANISGFLSLTDLTLEKAKKDIKSGREISIPLSSMNRFWFSPGDNLYREDRGVILIEKSPVLLLTEEEHLNKRGEITGKNKPDPLAQQFCTMFSAKYSKIARQKPIYLELENLFRWVALAKILKFKSVLSETNPDFGYLLNYYQISKAAVSSSLPGRSHVAEFKHKQDIAGGYQIAQLWLPSCGGVGIDIKVTQRNFVKDTSNKLAFMRTETLKSRPSVGTLFWEPPIIY